MGSDHGASIAFLGRVLCRWPGLVDRIGEADCLGFANGLSDRAKFRCRQISLAAFFREILDSPAGIETDWHSMGLAGEGKQTAQNPQQTVGLIGRVGIFAMQPLDFG